MDIQYGVCNWAEDSSDIKALYRLWTGVDYDGDMAVWNGCFYGAWVDQKLVAVIQLVTLPDPLRRRNIGLIENVFVHPDFRRQGIARRLMRGTLAGARLTGCQQVRLTTRKEDGQALYRDMGMEEGSAFYEVFR